MLDGGSAGTLPQGRDISQFRRHITYIDEIRSSYYHGGLHSSDPILMGNKQLVVMCIIGCYYGDNHQSEITLR